MSLKNYCLENKKEIHREIDISNDVLKYYCEGFQMIRWMRVLKRIGNICVGSSFKRPNFEDKDLEDENSENLSAMDINEVLEVKNYKEHRNDFTELSKSKLCQRDGLYISLFCSINEFYTKPLCCDNMIYVDSQKDGPHRYFPVYKKDDVILFMDVVNTFVEIVGGQWLGEHHFLESIFTRGDMHNGHRLFLLSFGS